MTMHFRAAEVPVEDRFDYWRQVIGESLVPLQNRFDHGPDFDARITTSEAGPVRITDSITGPGASFRTPRLIRRSDPEVYMIGVLVNGQMTFDQDDRQARLLPGDLALFDPSRPASRVHTRMRNIAMSIPRAMLPFSPDELARITAVRIDGERGVAALGSRLVRQFATRLKDLNTRESARLGPTLVDLLTVALGSRLDRAEAVPVEAKQSVLLQRIYAFIEQHLSDPELSPSVIAAAHHISLRYLHKLFQHEPSSVAGYVRRRRLERCRRDLVDPALVARPVSAIAARWGLTNSAHFNRAFRAAFGLPPAEFRLVHGPSLD
jgi:AraC-like DNA-binding protein